MSPTSRLVTPARIALALIIANEIRGLVVVASVLAATGWDLGAIIKAVGL